MSSFMTRWSVLVEHAVGPGDRDPGGTVSNAAVARWVDGTCAAYLQQCMTLQRRRDDGLAIRTTPGAVPAASSLGPATVVVVSASATEVFPDAFVVSVRLRSVVEGDDSGIANATCTVTVVDEGGAVQAIDPVLRDELIALEHAARHFN
jgi:hypothetical protein